MTEGVRAALELALRHGLSYTGLRDVRPDARLLRYVPLDLARREHVLPVVLVGDALKVASAGARPDMSAVQHSFPGLAVEVVIAPAAEIDRALELLA